MMVSGFNVGFNVEILTVLVVGVYSQHMYGKFWQGTDERGIYQGCGYTVQSGVEIQII